jgi:transaldolase/glucose-6-phosphate isomerase
MPGGRVASQTLELGPYSSDVTGRLKQWEEEQISRRIWEKDFTVWAQSHLPEITDRLGWLHLPETMKPEVDHLKPFADQIRSDGIRHIALLGIGGSSLAAEVFHTTFGSAMGRAELIVLDSTHPRQVKAVASRVDLRRTLFIVASKSGTTIEPLSFFKYFYGKTQEAIAEPAQAFVAITDPGTPLEQLAAERGFRHTFLATSDVGGRYSAFSHFGLVPAALIGVDVEGLLSAGAVMAEACGPSVPVEANPALVLGAALGELAKGGRDKVTFLTSPSLSAFPSWLEQLIAESTGKDGKGIVPVVDEPLGRPVAYGADRLFVHLCLSNEAYTQVDSQLRALEDAGHPVVRVTLGDKSDLGGEVFRWEMAVASAGAVLGVHPFNQPDVQMAKDLARKAMAEGASRDLKVQRSAISVERAEDLAVHLKRLRAWVREGDYLGIQAYLAPSAPIRNALQGLRSALRDSLGLATTLGFGPRFLHSTGQLHKGGPSNGVFIQLIDDPGQDVPVPETDFTFGRLISAQAMGDYRALTEWNPRVIRIFLGDDVLRGLELLMAAL